MGHLFTGHSVVGLRGPEFRTVVPPRDAGNWPATVARELIESGEIDGGEGVHTYFPAVGVNGLGQVAMVHGMSSADTRISVAATGRNPATARDRRRCRAVLEEGPVDGGGRLGDYYGLTVVPGRHDLLAGRGVPGETRVGDLDRPVHRRGAGGAAGGRTTRGRWLAAWDADRCDGERPAHAGSVV